MVTPSIPRERSELTFTEICVSYSLKVQESFQKIDSVFGARFVFRTGLSGVPYSLKACFDVDCFDVVMQGTNCLSSAAF